MLNCTLTNICWKRQAAAISFLLAIFTAGANAQSPQLSSVFPPGGRRGASVPLKLSGKNLKNIRRLYFSHPGIKSQAVKGNIVTVAIAKTVPEGDYDMWAMTESGLTNPRRFMVGRFVETNEKEKNNTPSSAQKITFPLTINGSLNPGTDRDYFQLDFKKGTLVHCVVRSQSLDGSALCALTLFGPDGRELLHDDGRDAEPALDFQVLKSGTYLFKVEERGFQSGDNNVYRLSFFTGPRLVAAHPMVLTRGKAQPITLYGYSIPNGITIAKPTKPAETKPQVTALPLQQLQIQLQAPDSGDDDGGGRLGSHAAMIEGFCFRRPGTFGTLRFGLTNEAVTVDTDADQGSLKKARRAPFPCTISGRFMRSREADWYRISFKKGQSVWFETQGERGGKVMDLELAVHDAGGKVVMTASDHAVKKSPVPVDTLDALAAWKAPVDGDYYVVVRDLYGTTRFGVRRGFRLSVGKRLERVCVAAIPTGKGPSAATRNC